MIVNQLGWVWEMKERLEGLEENGDGEVEWRAE